MPANSENPYEPPLTAPAPPAASMAEAPVRGFSLVRISSILAGYLGLLIGPNLSGMFFSARAEGPAIVVEAFCLTAILAPLAIYFWWNGRPGVSAAVGRIAFIAVVLFLHVVAVAMMAFRGLVPR